jgi:uncharacterized protein VirK/YbjX
VYKKHTLRTSQVAYPVNSFKSLLTRFKFLLSAFVHRKTLKSFIDDIYAMRFSELFNHEIPLLVVVHSPYIHNQWDVQERFKVISNHYKMIRKMPCVLNLVDGQPKILLDLSQYSAGTFITLDKAKWFVREGELVLNIFKDDLRMMSIAFTFSKINNESVVYIGAIQGKQSSNETLSTLKELSKSFEGLRPADLLLEILRMLAANLGISKILAISDENRHHRHKHFSHSQTNLLKTNYNEKWLENQGIPLNNGFYSLPIKKSRKDFAEIASNKRAVYRRRYNMLDEIEVALNQVLSSSKAEHTAASDAFANTNLYPEAEIMANAMYEIANGRIQLGEVARAKVILRKLIKDYPNAEIVPTAKERLASINT